MLKQVKNLGLGFLAGIVLAYFNVVAGHMSTSGSLVLGGWIGFPILAIAFVGVTVTLVRTKRANRAREQTFKAALKDRNRRIEELEDNALRALRASWLTSSSNARYGNEIEVEVKFVQPLLQFLGYHANAYEVRRRVKFQMGRQQYAGEADWVIWSGPDRRQARIVIEVKGPKTRLDGAVQAQARSYAFALNAPLYVLTNGQRLQVYKRGVEGDLCIVGCGVDELQERWTEVEEILGVDAG